MVLYRYFQPLNAGTVPDPSGPLSAYVSPGAIKDANEAARNASHSSSKPRIKYTKFTPEQKEFVGEYASLHRNQAAIHCFLKHLGVEMKPTSVPKSAASIKLVRQAISASSPCPSRSVGDLCYSVKS